MHSDKVTFELWESKPYSIAGEELQSAINIAGQYWQGKGFLKDSAQSVIT